MSILSQETVACVDLNNNLAYGRVKSKYKNGWLEKECVTPIEAHSLVNIIPKIEHPVTCLATMAYVYVQLCAVLFLVLAVNSEWFQILQSYMLLLKPPVLMHSWPGVSYICCYI